MPRRPRPPALLCLAAALPALLLLCRDALPGDAEAPALRPRTVTLQAKGIPCDKALAQLSLKTGVPLRDRRAKQPGPPLDLDLQGATFWQAVDAVARQAGAGVSVYEADGGVALVEPPPGPQHVSLDGVVRSTFKQLTFTRDLATGTHSGTAAVEVAWEPGFRPLLADVRSYEATFAPDARKHVLRVKRQGTGPLPVDDRPAVEVELPLPAPERSAPALAELKGDVVLTGPSRMLTVRFDNLARAAKTGKPQVQTPEKGITVTLRKLEVVDTDRWEAELVLSYPPGGPQFESFRDWLAYNKIYLEKGRRRFVPGPADQQVQRGPHGAVVRYYFVEGKGRPRLGNPGDWSLVYETPGRIVEVPAHFRFENLPLP